MYLEGGRKRLYIYIIISHGRYRLYIFHLVGGLERLFFIFFPYSGNNNPSDFHIFQRGWPPTSHVFCLHGVSAEVETVLVEVAHFEATVLTVRVRSPGDGCSSGFTWGLTENERGDFRVFPMISSNFMGFQWWCHKISWDDHGIFRYEWGIFSRDIFMGFRWMMVVIIWDVICCYLVGGKKTCFIFHFIYGMSSETHWRTISYCSRWFYCTTKQFLLITHGIQ